MKTLCITAQGLLCIGRDSNGHQERWITVYRKQNRIVFDASLGNQRGIFLP